MSIKYLVDQQLTKVILRPHMYSCQQANHSQVKSDFFKLSVKFQKRVEEALLKSRIFFPWLCQLERSLTPKITSRMQTLVVTTTKKIIFTAFK